MDEPTNQKVVFCGVFAGFFDVFMASVQFLWGF